MPTYSSGFKSSKSCARENEAIGQTANFLAKRAYKSNEWSRGCVSFKNLSRFKRYLKHVFLLRRLQQKQLCQKYLRDHTCFRPRFHSLRPPSLDFFLSGRFEHRDELNRRPSKLKILEIFFFEQHTLHFILILKDFNWAPVIMEEVLRISASSANSGLIQGCLRHSSTVALFFISLTNRREIKSLAGLERKLTL